MFTDFKEWISNTVVIRLFILIFVFIALFAVLIHRLFVFQIIDGEKYLVELTEKELSQFLQELTDKYKKIVDNVD